MDLALYDMQQITAAIQRFVDMENQEWQSFRKGALTLAQSYTDSLDVDKLYRTLFEN
jgi:hypothetical protein